MGRRGKARGEVREFLPLMPSKGASLTVAILPLFLQLLSDPTPDSNPVEVPLCDSNLNGFSLAFSLRTPDLLFLQPSGWLCGFLPQLISSGLTHYSLVSQLFYHLNNPFLVLNYLKTPTVIFIFLTWSLTNMIHTQLDPSELIDKIY